MEANANRVESFVREQLERHPHFRGRTGLLKIESVGRSVIVSGRLPTYYLKQLLQEAIKLIPDVEIIENQVQVSAMPQESGPGRVERG